MNKEPNRGVRFQIEEAVVWVLKSLGFKGAQSTGPLLLHLLHHVISVRSLI